MRVDVIYTFGRLLDNQISNHTVIVVDALRATSCIVWAVKNGAAKVIPTQDPGDAVAVAGRLGIQDCVLAGERGGLPIPGFNIGNSPHEFGPETVRNKTVIISTTNGTAALYGARNAKKALVGAMINRTAAGVRAAEEGNDIIVLCAGTAGQVSAEDIVAASAIAEAVCAHSQAELTDAAIISLATFQNFLDGRLDMALTGHYRALTALGFEKDVEFCLTQDLTDVVPCYDNGVIR